MSPNLFSREACQHLTHYQTSSAAVYFKKCPIVFTADSAANFGVSQLCIQLKTVADRGKLLRPLKTMQDT